MGSTLHIFKKYSTQINFEEFTEMVFDENENNYISTDHSYSTIDKIFDMFSDIGIKFPCFNTTELNDDDIDKLINPEEMIKACDLLLQKDDIFKMYDAEYTKEYIKYFKEISEQGYYLLYESSVI